MNNVKTANDLISDSVDAFVAGNEEMASQYLDEALGMKKSERMFDVLSTLPEFQQG